MAAVAWLAAQPGLAHAEDLAPLPSVIAPPLDGPPLATSAAPGEVRLPRAIASSETVVVDLGPDGAPTRVRVRQRLEVHGKGDYAFEVPAPLLTVARAPGSESEPGARNGVVLWQGFSAGSRTLIADVPLALVEAARYLPLHFGLRRTGGTRKLVVENATGTNATERSITGSITPSEAARVLDELRAALARGRPAGDRYVSVEGLEPGSAPHTNVALHVTGNVRAGGRTFAFSRIVTVERELVVPLPSSGPIRVVATAVPIAPDAVMRPPGGVSWSSAAAAGRLRGGRALLERVLAARLDAARYRQYTQFLANPDRLGAARAVYVFRSSATPRAGEAADAPSDGWGVLRIALIAVGVVAAGAGLLVWWAHS